ncbi:hypothetical protein HID58_023221 [Brassica napus]|uniref:BnaA06g25510D protein n=2 Tax=Brassica napus TaxID=3708 RepID=A0A078GUI8_BRANA|nr:hypothetical protein HID58_023221 [Brassica napus]CAF2088445.1 unnamed protein product [Brassica napus]CDY29206.1 BnaA06g25510D [Brassica napus]
MPVLVRSSPTIFDLTWRLFLIPHRRCNPSPTYIPQGQENNPNFLKHVSSLFNQTDHLVVGYTYKSEVRSLYATRVLVYSVKCMNMDGGYIALMEKRFLVKVELKYDEL